ncbi:HdeD family acid-resistance protein [Metalysinibacillus jejuensis]|uniref:HdeD family acid-resistance protein n=1 Tax=Metalysinibacillus jejuensis TaxID=914327 RepID=UPI00137AFE26|nr:DUF308 domain-containing protein [Metalysinibacillus jejuensis]
MLDILRKIQTHLIINSIIFIIVGSFILASPKTAYDVMIIIVASYFLVTGIIRIVTALYHRKYDQGMMGSLVLATLYIVAAVLLYTLADDMIKVIPYLIGFVILIVGVSHLVNTISFRTFFPVNKMPFYIYSIVLIVVSLFLLTRPVSMLTLLFQFYGVSLIVIGIVDLALLFYLKRKIIIR